MLEKSDIAELSKAHIDQLVASGAIESKVNAAVEKCVSEAIKDAFSNYSDFAKAVKEAIKSSVAVNLEGLGVAGYNELVRVILRDKLTTYFEQTATQEIESSMSKLLAEFPKTITVTKLCEMFREYCRENGDGNFYDQRFTFMLERSERTDGWFDIGLDDEDKKPRHTWECRYSLRCKPDGVWAAKIDGTEVATSKRRPVFIGPCYGFERFLFHAYANHVIIEIDTDEPDTGLGDE